MKVEYTYDGDGNLARRIDGSGAVTYQFDPLQRETVRTLQDGSQTLLVYTPAGNIDYYQDPAGKVDYTWNEVNKLTQLKDPQGRATRTATTATTSAPPPITPAERSRRSMSTTPAAPRASRRPPPRAPWSASTTPTTTAATAWSYDKAGNETSADSNPDSTRTAETWTDHSQLSSITARDTTFDGQYASTDQSERIKLGTTLFHNGPLGLSAETRAGTDMSFNREPGGTLNSMTTGGKTHVYLTDAIGSVVATADTDGNKVDSYIYSPRGVRIMDQSSEPVDQPYRFAGNYQDRTASTTSAPATTTPTSAASRSPTPPAKRRTPTSTPTATPSTASTPRDSSVSVVSRMHSARLATSPPERPTWPRETLKPCGAMSQVRSSVAQQEPCAERQ